MLDHLGLGETASRIRGSLTAVVTEGETVTRDLGGAAAASTTEFSAAVIERMQAGAATV
jgi:isocitrate dehydrogenase (NAD+)